MAPKFKVGDVIRYGSGSTALMRVTLVSTSTIDPRYWGEQYYGGGVGAYESDCSPPTADDLRSWEGRAAEGVDDPSDHDVPWLHALACARMAHPSAGDVLDYVRASARFNAGRPFSPEVMWAAKREEDTGTLAAKGRAALAAPEPPAAPLPDDGLQDESQSRGETLPELLAQMRGVLDATLFPTSDHSVERVRMLYGLLDRAQDSSRRTVVAYTTLQATLEREGLASPAQRDAARGAMALLRSLNEAVAREERLRDRRWAAEVPDHSPISERQADPDGEAQSAFGAPAPLPPTEAATKKGAPEPGWEAKLDAAVSRYAIDQDEDERDPVDEGWIQTSDLAVARHVVAGLTDGSTLGCEPDEVGDLCKAAGEVLGKYGCFPELDDAPAAAAPLGRWSTRRSGGCLTWTRWSELSQRATLGEYSHVWQSDALRPVGDDPRCYCSPIYRCDWCSRSRPTSDGNGEVG